MSKSRRAVWITLAVLGGLLALLLLILVSTVDDWSRDLSTNVARTTDDARDPALRPLEVAGSLGELEAWLRSFAEKKPHWEFVEARDAADGSREVHLVRVTRLMRFRDDVTVWLHPLPAGAEQAPRARIEAESRSRVGKGDLGQNPRNLKELLGELRAAQLKAIGA